MFTFLYVIIFQSFVLLSVVIDLVASGGDVTGVLQYLFSQSHPGLILRNFYQQRQKKTITRQNIIQNFSFQHLNNQILAVFFILKVSIFKDLNSPCPHHFLFNGSINVSDKTDTVSTVPVMFHYFSISSLNFWRHPCCRPDNLSTPSPKHPTESFWIKIQLNFPSSH